MQSIVITQVQDVDYIQSCLKYSVTMILWEVPSSVMQLNDVVWEQVSCVVVAVRDEQMKKEIIVWLTNYISDGIILDFWQIYYASIPTRRVDRILMNPYIPAFEGLVFGISHAEVGLLSELFDVPFANLAVSSQDIYYNYKTLKYAVENYYHKLQDVKYVIIDMFRYNYFNYDVSKSRSAMGYYSMSGFFDDAHYFGEEKCNALEDYILNKRLQGITEHKLDLWECIFGDVHQMDGYNGFETWPEIYRRNQIVDDNMVLEYDFNKSIVKKRFDSTIQENIEYFKQMLLLIRKFWPKARIMVLLMPLYELALTQSQALYATWRQEFEEILQGMQEVVSFEYFDYTYHDISKKKQCWQDFEHLNYTGAICFTKEINELLCCEQKG